MVGELWVTVRGGGTLGGLLLDAMFQHRLTPREEHTPDRKPAGCTSEDPSDRVGS